MTRLGRNRYGKAAVHLVRIGRGEAADGGDLLRDWTVSTSLSGDLAATHLSGDNADVLSTDAQKNAVFAFTSRLGTVEPEVAALALAAYFRHSQQAISLARVTIVEQRWQRVAGRPHSFQRCGGPDRTVRVSDDADSGIVVTAGLSGLVLLNTTDSEFRGFPRDEFTTLAETDDRVLATEVSASWRYREPAADWAACFSKAEQALVEAFTDTYSYSLQQTLYAMGDRLLRKVPQACEVRLALPNKHHFLADLQPFGMANPNEVYRAADQPYGLIEATVLADDAEEMGLDWC
ncbi:MAG: urate oxidase [Actinomycetota bacterium]|nr:urate oxidase [Actinomycetota bacterium]MDQ2956412.1 urate oxidase [Actinomycetota bacterium]